MNFPWLTLAGGTLPCQLTGSNAGAVELSGTATPLAQLSLHEHRAGS